jgi:hemoglobin
MLAEHEVFQMVGEAGFSRLCSAFYRQIPQDELLGPMYPASDLLGAESRLREFLIYRFGGPQDYLEHRGHPRLRMRHAPFPITSAARDRWMQLMNNALDEAELPPAAAATLAQFFEHMSTFLINRPTV